MIRILNMRLCGIAVGLVLCSTSASSYVQAQSALPKVLVIATGGTIAGEQAEPGSLGPYSIKKSVNEVVGLVPQVKTYAQVETEQFSNVPSPNITPEQWLKLAKRINAVFNARPDLAGIVVTHGTARLEETAFFLHLTVKSEKPVVVLGAQRPPTAISPDGPINLLSAIRVAAAPESKSKGVLVVMDDRVISARDVHYSYAGSEGPGRTDAKAVIVATTGFSPGERAYYDALQKRGVVIATTFPSGDHVGSPAFDKEVFPTIVVQRLLPTHARILMMLALTKTQELREIQRIFLEY